MSDTQSQTIETLLNGPAPALDTKSEPVSEAVETGDNQPASEPPSDVKETPDVGPLVPRKALEDERRKRQETERRLTELEALARANQERHQQRQTEQQPPDWWSDPEAAAQHQQRQFQIQIYETRLALGEELLSSRDDYPDAKAAFIEAAQSDRNLALKLVQHTNPAKFAYETGRKILADREVGGDLAAYKAKLRAEWEAEQAAAGGRMPQAPKAPAPKSLAGQPSAQPRDSAGRFAGPASLHDILGG